MDQQIWDAIAAKHVLSFHYGDEFAVRRVEPHAYGTNETGDEVLFAWQVSGPSDSSPFQPGWRVFSMNDLSDLTVTRETFRASRPGYQPGGTPIATIYCQL